MLWWELSLKAVDQKYIFMPRRKVSFLWGRQKCIHKEYIFLVAGKALHWNDKARMRSFFSERNIFFSAINSFFFEIWMVVKTKRSEVLAVQIEKKKELIKEKKIFLEEKKSIRDLSLKLATFFSY